MSISAFFDQCLVGLLTRCWFFIIGQIGRHGLQFEPFLVYRFSMTPKTYWWGKKIFRGAYLLLAPYWKFEKMKKGPTLGAYIFDISNQKLKNKIASRREIFSIFQKKYCQFFFSFEKWSKIFKNSQKMLGKFRRMI